MWHRQCVFIFLMWVALACSPARGGSQEGAVDSGLSSEDVAEFAKRVEKYAAQRGARLFLVARQGSPQSRLPEGVSFTHVGIAVYSAIRTDDGQTHRGYAIHNLYQDPNDPAHSRLVTDYPVDFFQGGVALKAGILIPEPLLQKKLLMAMQQGMSERLHNPRYSVIANPYSTTYQNCTEHTLDLIFSALYSTDSLRQIKVNQSAYFRAHSFEVSPFERLLAPVFSDDIRWQDQGKTIQVATFSSIARFLEEHQLAMHLATLDGSQGYDQWRDRTGDGPT